MAYIAAKRASEQYPNTLSDVESVVIDTDILIIGGGNAGCFAAWEARRLNPDVKIAIMEKADIMRSGACAAGMDAINTYIPEDKTPEDLVRWSRAQVGGGPLREDLALSNAQELNECVDDLERWGIPFLKDKDGRKHYRGRWDISIHGEQLKPIMAEKAIESADVYNRITATSLIVRNGICLGATGLGVRDGKFYIFHAKATIVSTGGAGTLYKSYTADSTDCGAQIWMCPYCVGSGYAIGFRKGAELTSLEQRWVATRTKDYCGPVDTISVGYHSPIINAKGERVMSRYQEYGGDAAPRFIRANAPMEEWLNGRGPCYCDTTNLSAQGAREMMEDYLKSKNIRVSAGHCTGYDLSEVEQVTHLYNAMGAFSHKEKSTAVSALADDRIYTELIADGRHVQDDVLKITFRTKPLNKIILISDALPITHSNKESMIFCSKNVFLKDGKAVDANGTMAGSTTFVSDIIKRLVKNNILNLHTAAAMASDNLVYIQKPDAKIYWDKDCSVCAMNFNGNVITF